ncbi:MAG: hypothetical protein Q8P26_02950 [Candidatus Levybacteria bacterium]|nr:hypothetical protein [Candidatus Levybacteria bacterium]
MAMRQEQEARPVEIFSPNQLILPETVLPQEVEEVLRRSEKVGLGLFEPYRLSDTILNQSNIRETLDYKPKSHYWHLIRDGAISGDSPKLPNAWVLIDKTQKPDYKNGRQMYEGDPLGLLLSKLRSEGKIQKVKELSDASRFGIIHDELIQIVLPEIAKILGLDSSQVRLPKVIEFNVIGNLKHQEWGKTNTTEVFADKFGHLNQLVGGNFDRGGLSDVVSSTYGFFNLRSGRIGFRPMIVLFSW